LTPDSPRDPNERFRQRREQARKRRRQHRSIARAVVIVLAALVALGATVIGTRAAHDEASKSATKPEKKTNAEAIRRTPLPQEVRGAS
jgi:flagellar basal body-associated protein FliL